MAGNQIDAIDPQRTSAILVRNPDYTDLRGRAPPSDAPNLLN